MPQIAPERPAVRGAARPVPAVRRRRWRYLLIPAAVLLIADCVAVLSVLSGGFRLTSLQQAGDLAVLANGGTGVVRVEPSTGRVLGGARFAEVNGIAVGMGSLWLTGGSAGHNHVLYAVDPAASRVRARIDLPSRLVINPGDVAVGSGAVWVAVGANVYRVEPGDSGAVTRAFAALPRSHLVGDVAAGSGSVWVTDATGGKVYRFSAATGRLAAVVPVGTTAGVLAVGDGGVWVASPGARTVSRISVARNRVDQVVSVPGVPGHIVAAGGALWLTDGTANVVSVSGGAHARLRTVWVGGGPTGIAADGGTVWVANSGNGTLTRIAARRHLVTGTFGVGARPYAVAAGPRGVWVALVGTAGMMDTPPARSALSSAAKVVGWLARLCGA